jgi:cobalamin biosynthesis Mg chelatase CobN
MGLPAKGSTATTIAPTPEEAAAAAAAAAGAAAGAPTTSSTRKNKTTEVAAQRASASRDAGDGAGSPLPSILGFAAVMVMLAAGIFFARRARAGNRPSAP